MAAPRKAVEKTPEKSDNPLLTVEITAEKDFLVMLAKVIPALQFPPEKWGQQLVVAKLLWDQTESS